MGNESQKFITHPCPHCISGLFERGDPALLIAMIDVDHNLLMMDPIEEEN